LKRASRDVQDAFPSLKCYKFAALWGLIVTWHNVTFLGASTKPYPVYITITLTDMYGAAEIILPKLR